MVPGTVENAAGRSASGRGPGGARAARGASRGRRTRARRRSRPPPAPSCRAGCPRSCRPWPSSAPMLSGRSGRRPPARRVARRDARRTFGIVNVTTATQVLGLRSAAPDRDDLVGAWRRYARTHHPDRCPGDPGAGVALRDGAGGLRDAHRAGGRAGPRAAGHGVRPHGRRARPRRRTGDPVRDAAPPHPGVARVATDPARQGPLHHTAEPAPRNVEFPAVRCERSEPQAPLKRAC